MRLISYLPIGFICQVVELKQDNNDDGLFGQTGRPIIKYTLGGKRSWCRKSLSSFSGDGRKQSPMFGLYNFLVIV
jgi:hypothetical protein